MQPLERLAARSWVVAALVVAAALAVYVATAAPGLTWAHHGADGGDLIAACATGGVPHPSGYPTYCLLARAFAALVPANAARAYTLFSALAAALAAGFACLATRCVLLHLGQGAVRATVLAAGAGLVFALGSGLWSQAVIAEVYALHALFVAGLVWGALSLSEGSPPAAWLGLGLAAGLGLGNHLTLGLVLPGLALWLWPLRRPGRVAALAGGLVLGLCVYLYVPLAARGHPPVAWGDPRDAGGFWWLVSGRLYRGYAFATPWTHVPARLAALAALARVQFTLPGLALLLFGLEDAGRAHRRLLWAAALLVLLPAVYAIGYNTVDSDAYLLPVWLAGTFWLAAGAGSLARRLAARQGLDRLALAAPLLIAVGLGVGNHRAMNLSGDRAAEEWLAAVAAEAPRGALVVTGEDGHTFALAYGQWVMGERRDLLVVDGELWEYAWYRAQVARRDPATAVAGSRDLATRDLAGRDLADLVSDWLRHGPVCLSTERPALEAGYRVAPAGVLRCLTRAGQ